MKKIIFSTYDDVENPYYAGGGAHAISEIAKRLSDVFEITIITGNYKGAKNINKNGVAYKRIGPQFLGPKIGQIAFSFLLPYYARRERFDVWVESLTPPFSTSFLPLFTKKPIIGLVHMLPSEDMQRKYKLPFYIVENAGLKVYKKFIVLSDIFKKKIERINKKAEIVIISNGIAEVKKKLINSTEKYILFLGRLEYNQKGLDLLLDAYRKANISKRLIIAGSGLEKDIKQIKNKIKINGLQKKVKLVGKVTGSKKEELLNNCLAVVVPSRFETFGVVALEAFAHGKPIVCFAVTGLNWIPQDCAIKVKPFYTDAYGMAIDRIITDKKLNDSMGKAGKIEAKKYSWEKIVEKYKEVLSK
jgi:glycosyltransferase involved in cell wall biosynthesis